MIFKPEFIENGFFSEYPRPQLKRQSFFNLCGEWDYAITKTSDLLDSFDGKILVPFCPESKLSGVNRQLKKDEFLHLSKHFTLPQGFNRGRVILNVGAIDQCAKIYLNGKLLLEHNDGYNSFSVELENIVEGENHLYILVTDDADSPIYGRGKQTYKRGGIWYTATSGIWQPVWIESVPTDYIKGFKLYPDFDNQTLTVTFDTTDPQKSVYVSVIDQNQIVKEGQSDKNKVVIDLKGLKPWSPNNPQLYPIKFNYGNDAVESYFGLRKFSKVKIGDKYYFAINNEPIFLNGLLDQGYFPDGFYTPKSNKVLYEQVSQVKDLGYNMLRKHIKVEPDLWYYYCDILGMVVWQDMINGGAKYSPVRIAIMPFIRLKLKDTNYKLMKRADPRSREQYVLEANRLIDRLFNCVSLQLYTPFNEGWGQFDAVKNYNLLSQKDGTRLYDHASGWIDKGAGDTNSRHIYFRKARPKSDGKRVLTLSEFGGYSLRVAGHESSPKKFGYKRFKNADALTKAYKNLYYNEVVPLIKTQGLSATVYTQLTDVEDEDNGIFTYDGVLKINKDTLKDINKAVYEAFDKHVFGAKE